MSHRTELNIVGMTCGHCVAAVKNALNALPGVSNVSVDLGSGRAIVDHSTPLDASQVEKVIEEEGYALNVA